MLDFNSEFVEEVMLSLARLESSSIAIAAYKMYQKWILDGKLTQFNPKFGITFVNTCFGSSFELAEAGRKVMELVIIDKQGELKDFLPGLTCASIYEIKDKKKTKRIEPQDAIQVALDALKVLKDSIKLYEVSDINPVIRALGRRRLVTPIFELLDCMRDAGIIIIFTISTIIFIQLFLSNFCVLYFDCFYHS